MKTIFDLDTTNPRSYSGGDVWVNLVQEKQLSIIDRIAFVFNIRTKRFNEWREYRPEDYDFI